MRLPLFGRNAAQQVRREDWETGQPQEWRKWRFQSETDTAFSNAINQDGTPEGGNVLIASERRTLHGAQREQHVIDCHRRTIVPCHAASQRKGVDCPALINRPRLGKRRHG